jgi:hypothetical protein
MKLERFTWLAGEGPPGAVDGLAAYRLIDTAARPARDTAGRDWTPVLAADDTVLIDPSPALWDRLLAAAGYFERPQAFGSGLLFQMHRFALDYYQGCQVRESALSIAEEELIVRGSAYRGAGAEIENGAFETRAGRSRPAVFAVEFL